MKQYYKLLLFKLGLINEAEFRLKINRIKPDDVFILSYPKSGNTWVRFLIAHLISKKDITMQNIDDIVPNAYASVALTNQMQTRRFIKVHDALPASFSKTVYICRDYRDAMVSNFHYFTIRKNFKGTFSEFIRSDLSHYPFGDWRSHVSKALAFSETHTERILFIKYEDLLNRPQNIVEKIISFTGIQPVRPVEEAIRLCSFENLKETENKHEGKYKQLTGKNFFREGKSNQWKDYFKEEDLKYISEDKELMSLMHKLDYIEK